METTKLKRFAQFARSKLIEQVSAKLKLVLSEESAARRESAAAIRKLEEAIQKHTKDQVIERVAYIWFNRFCALRFMDVNRYNRVGVVSPAEGQFQPEILAEAKMGHIDDEMVHDKIRQQIFALLDGKAPSRDPQGEAYRLLVVAACNYWNKAMPFLFQRIEDYTELLMPDDLLSSNSILAHMREAISYQLSVISNEHEPADNCTLNTEGLEVEVIGWLYQFYISEKKDEVFDGLKKNKKITPENIPAATQLFTPHWIVKYLVENSLGRLWMLNRPNSRLVDRMEYYIRPESTQSSVVSNQQGENTDNCTLTTDYLRVSSPEEIKICDPACGSGHMLTYAFDLLYAIYEEEGYEPADIPEKILTNNLYGIEIDERAGELAAFALTMKALQHDKRFFRRAAARGELVEPNICVLENVHFDEDELKEYMDFVGRDLFTLGLENTLRQFEEADNFGSLIRPDVTDVDGMLRILESKNVSGQLFISITHQKVLQALQQADYLSPKYHVVIANPPYMGGKGMNGRLKVFLQDFYPGYKSDLFSAFVVRCSELGTEHSNIGIMSPNVWMYIASHERLRTFLTESRALYSLIELPLTGFKGATVQICAYNFSNKSSPNLQGGYIRLVDFKGADEEMAAFTKEAIRNNDCGWFHHAYVRDFWTIPGRPIAYWVSEKFRQSFVETKNLKDVGEPRLGMATGNNDVYLRLWQEVSIQKVGLGFDSRDAALASGKKWFPYNKGGQFRRWYGNNEFVVNWENDGQLLRNTLHPSGERIWAHNFNLDYIFKPCLTFTATSSSYFGIRYSEKGFLFDNKGSSYFSSAEKLKPILGLLASKPATAILKAINPTVEFQPGNISVIPFFEELVRPDVSHQVQSIVDICKGDWDDYETSWNFNSLPLLNPDYRQPTLKATYQKLRAHWREMTLEMQRLEQENNRIFIDAYGLQDELTPEVPLNEITLTCNPHYRYSNGKSEEELEALLLADTMRELASYAVGCMFGRYSLNAPGLILANQGEGFDDYWRILKSNQLSVVSGQKSTENCTLITDNLSDNSLSSFTPDEDNVIPMLDGDWFADDITERFRQFLRVAFGEEHYEENLKFVEQALNVKGKRDYTLRDYFLGEFYADHVKRYKKRPIYWLFSSPKGTFNALIYMHRYRPDTVSVVLNDYLREFRTKLTAHKNHLEAVSISANASQGEKTKALKEIEKIKKMIAELEEYEREVLYPLATQQINIDLDDGVKANYVKFGSALKKIVGLDASED